MKKQNSILFALIVVSFHASNAQEWTKLSEVTGLAQSLCAHQGTTLILGQPGGPFLSTDNGTTWIDSESNNSVTWSIASDGVNLYEASVGVQRSMDNGVTWTEANVGLPSSPIVYVVAAVGGKVFAGLYGGVYASTNGGSSWTRSDSGITHFVITSIAGEGDTVFAGTSDGKVFRSTNAGLYWTDVSPTLYSSSNKVNVIFIADGSVLLGDTGPGFSPGILRSDDWGMTWTQFSTGINEPDWGYIAGFARVDTFLFAGLYDTSFNHGGVYRGSLNTDWTNVSAAQMIAIAPDTHYVHAWSLAAMGTTVFAGMSAGLYRSTDLGTTWQQITSDVSNGNEERIAFAFRDDTLYTGGSGSGAFISIDNGAFWEEHVTNLPFHITSYAFVDTVMFAGHSSNGGVSRSTDGGRVWESIASGLPSSARSVNKLASSGTTLLAATGGGMYVSSDFGDSWTITSWSALGPVSLHASESVVLASDQYEVYRSTDVGQTWVQITNGLPTSFYVRDFARIGSNLFMGGGPEPYMFMSTDEGLSWSGISGFALPVWALAAAGDTLYAATQYFVYYTTDLGQNWQLIPNDGLTGVSGFRALMVKGGYLYAGMNASGYGAIRRPVDGSTSVEQIVDGIPERMMLLQNYPNPFNPNTTIQFAIPRSGFVSLTMYDLLGREVALLVNEEKTPGTYTVPWNASGMASGVYVYRIIAGEFVQSRKMILAR